MRACQQRSLIATLSLIALLTASSAEAGPVHMIDQFWSEMQRMAQLESMPEREAIIAELFAAHFDFEGFYERSLRDHWSQWSETQRQQFAKPFRRRFTGQVAGKFDRILGKLDRPLSHEGFWKPWGYEVKSTTSTSRGQFVITSYLRQVDGQWKIVDLDIEGALLSRNYQGQFNNILRRFGFAELIDRLKNKRA